MLKFYAPRTWMAVACLATYCSATAGELDKPLRLFDANGVAFGRYVYRVAYFNLKGFGVVSSVVNQCSETSMKLCFSGRAGFAGPDCTGAAYITSTYPMAGAPMAYVRKVGSTRLAYVAVSLETGTHEIQSQIGTSEEACENRPGFFTGFSTNPPVDITNKFPEPFTVR